MYTIPDYVFLWMSALQEWSFDRGSWVHFVIHHPLSPHTTLIQLLLRTRTSSSTILHLVSKDRSSFLRLEVRVMDSWSGCHSLIVMHRYHLMRGGNRQPSLLMCLISIIYRGNLLKLMQRKYEVFDTSNQKSLWKKDSRHLNGWYGQLLHFCLANVLV